MMKIEQTHIDQIRIAFEKMQSKQDFLDLLNLAKPLVYNQSSVPFDLKQITWYSNPKFTKIRYRKFKIRKKSGADRTIHAPVQGLKSIQKTLSFVLQCVFHPHHAAYGFVREKSIVDNAQVHVGNKFIYNIDLKDFFPSINQARVWKCLQLPPFNLSKEKTTNNFDEDLIELKENTSVISNNFYTIKNNWLSVNDSTQRNTRVQNFLKQDRTNIANIIAAICCTELEVERKNENGQWETVQRNVLPQGAPTSPIITNIVCQRLDFLLTGVAKRFGLKYSRYADDITFSSKHNVYENGSDFLKELHRILAQQDFHIKESKTRLQKDGHRKEVTGLLVNEKVNVQKRYIKQLRMWLYYWEKYGYERASQLFATQYFADKGHIKNLTPNMGNVIAGKLDYLKMVKGENNTLYLKLRERFIKISGITNFIDILLDTWENQGIEKAISHWKK